MRTRNYNFDIDKHSLIKPVVIIRSGDHDIDTIRVTLSEQGDPVDLTKATVTFMGTTPAGNKIIDDAHVKIVDATTGIFEYTFPSAAGASVGEYQDAYFSISMGNGQTSTMNFRIQVLSGVDISAPAASDYVTNFNTMVVNLNSAYDSATAATNTKMAAAVRSVATSAATVLDSALSNVATVNSQANNASSTANNAVSMASSVASAVTSQASYINSVASSAAADVNRALDKINNLSIGGRNLLTNTDKDVSITAHTTDPWPGWANIDTGFSFENGKTYTFSAEAKNSTDKIAEASIRVFEQSTNIEVGIYAFPADGKRHSVTFTIPNDSHKYNLLFYAGHAGIDPGVDLTTTYHHPKLEAGNVPTDWTPAPEDVDNTYLKKSQQLPTEARDFNYLATHMKTYQGTWWTGTNEILNGPTSGWTWATVEVIPGNAENTGIIRTTRFNKNGVYYASVDRGTIQRWSLIADDANVVHKTGNETLAGDKTLTGKLSAATFEAGGDKYTTTASVDVKYLGATISFVRIGKLVTFTSGVSSFNVGVSAGLTSGVIPNGFKPAVQQNISPANQSGPSNFFSFDQGGGIYSYGTYPSGAQPRLSWTYITTDAWPAN